ncbi:MAG: hypothetical protein HKP39_03960 [Eudoraea sp.]|nr:hypothetical protein [Eudoraea sp.]
MKKFALNLLFFIAIILLINCYFYKIVFENYFNEYEYVDLNNSTYLLSDSHGLPLEKQNNQFQFYNFAAGSDSYIDMKRKLQYLVENSKIKRLLISVDNHTLSIYRDNQNNLDRSNYFAKRNEYSNLYAYLKEKYIERFIPFISPKSRDILKINFQLEDNKTKVRKEWNTLSKKEKKAISIKRVKQQFPESNYSTKQKNALNDIISICNKNNIELIGIKFPLSNEYLDALDDSNYNSDTLLISNRIKVYNFSKQYVNSPALFKNQDHLNQTGGKMLSLKIYKILQKNDSIALDKLH